ncbi:pantoate--beta-alanine ligase [Solirubrobacter sp. CPCC 204708]|uniref:Pantothenate synthetase n=1 Tax=Solirubrobacter deserti TaxID=2282478 RepID=A0ABT4RTF3_9ACTN|nr:pantoate--beta-alanine ligase [Solirubrobacter deserti]MBE2316374.1 pantoate--beta-alanine ligase [Solirubrobacter deserti]MDA0141546.1 pantoate--beta-alanine ligase [Solirubrobacter deserti]
MRTIRTIAEMRAWLGNCRAENRSVGLVPTMGAFHAGHHSLMRAAKDEQDAVVVSLFVNPTQFNDPKDLQNYPRSEANDAVEASELGVDVLFAPPASEMYPEGFATTVSVAGLSEILEGAERGPGHFAGVCTVVCKLLNIVAPDAAYFGQKDAQQVAVVKRMVRDLDLSSKIEVLPTVREPDGLALSSRNVRLSSEDREQALSLSRALFAARDAVAAGERDVERIRAAALAQIEDPEYLAVVDPLTFSPLSTIAAPALVAVAARVGPVRLIDNLVLEPVPAPVAT